MKIYKVFGLLVLGLFLSAEGIAQEGFNQKIQDTIDHYGAVGLAIVVVKDDEIIHKESFGYKDKALGKKLKQDDLFRIASISKSFTATALMQLVDEGVLSLEDDVSDLIGFKVRNPRYPDDPITLKMILSHTSSLNDDQGYFTLDTINPSESKGYKKSYNGYKSGSEYEYCNMNFNLAGAILEKQTKQRFDGYIKHKVLDPLEIYGGYDADSLDQSKFAKIYFPDEESDQMTPAPGAYQSIAEQKEDYKIGYSAPIYSPTGGMKISAEDLAEYMRMHMNYGAVQNQQLISEQSAKEMQSPVIQASEHASYGLAMRIAKDLIEDEKMVGHTGDAYGLYSAMFFEPEEKFGFIVVTNGVKVQEKAGEYNSLLKPVINLLYDEFIRE